MLKYFKENKSRTLYIILTTYWLILLTATSLPGKDLPDLGVSDKIEHFTAYFILTFLLNIVLYLQDKFKLLKEKASLATLAIVALYGGFDELHQLFIPGRSCDILDWAADFLSASAAVLVVLFISQWLIPKLKSES